jgi:putative ABC transport system permease protein
MLDIALKNVFRQKIRSALTIIGIALGIGLILGLGAIGEGLNKQVAESVANTAAVVNVRAADESVGITSDVIDGIKDIIGVESVVPVGSYRITRGSRGGFGGRMIGFSPLGGGDRGGGSLTFTGINPSDQDYLIGDQIIASDGRKLDDSDDGKNVVLLGATIATSQNLNVGDEIEYQRDKNGTTESFFFEVVGILETTGQSSVDGAAYVPLKTMQDIEDTDKIDSLIVKVSDVGLTEGVTQDINNQFSDDVNAFSSLTIVRQIQSTLDTIQLAVYGIGAISVIVGGIGIMNTMIMSVMERRREIGIMKAIGATTITILTQVLQESAFLSLIGGLVGLMLGYISTILISQFTTFSTVLTPDLIVIGLGFSLVLGMGAGLYPAWSASQLDPIEVLRYE